MNYKIISTGSKGNCCILHEDVMVDCGVPYSKIKNELIQVKYLVDNTYTSRSYASQDHQTDCNNFPRIKMIGNYEVHDVYNCNIIANAGFDIVTDDYVFHPFEFVHDVLCYGYTWEWNGQSIIYATDTSTLDNAPAGKYDWLFLESNHDENKLEQVRDQHHGSYNPYVSGKRHLCTQQAKTFYYSNRKESGFTVH